MARSAEISTTNQEETLEAVYMPNITMRQNHTDEVKSSEPSAACNTARNHRYKLSNTARTSSRIMKTDVLMREPYSITMITRLFNTVPIPHIDMVVISLTENVKYICSYISEKLFPVGIPDEISPGYV